MNASNELNLIDPDEARLRRADGKLTLAVGVARYDDVVLVRVFPLSDADRYWGFVDGDGKDIGVIADPMRLEAKSRALALEELEKRYFLPVIQRVDRTREDYGSIVWTVQTDRGERTFTVRNMKDSIVELGGSRILLVDVDGNRYDIPDIRKLDPKSFDLILRSQ